MRAFLPGRVHGLGLFFTNPPLMEFAGGVTRCVPYMRLLWGGWEICDDYVRFIWEKLPTLDR